MAVVNKPYSYTDGETIDAARQNSNEAAIYNEFNGNIDNVNIKSAAGIDIEKLDDHSATNTEARAYTSPGTSGTPTKATTALAELQQLRFQLKASMVGANVKLMDNTNALIDAGWQEIPIRSQNLLSNASFDIYTGTDGAAGDAPDGWTLVGAPSVSSTDCDAIHGSGLKYVITSGGGVVGITQTISGLKASRRYLIGVYRKVTNVGASGGMQLVVAGALGSGNDYQSVTDENTSTDSISTAMAVIVQTDTIPSDLVVTLRTKATLDQFEVDDAFCYELGLNKSGAYGHLIQSVQDNTSSVVSNSATPAFTDFPNLDSITMRCPGPNYIMRCTAKVCVNIDNTTGSANTRGTTVRFNVDSSDVTADEMAAENINNHNQTFTLSATIYRTPTPGTDHVVKLRIHEMDSTGSSVLTVNPQINFGGGGGSTSVAGDSRLTVEMIPLNGGIAVL